MYLMTGTRREAEWEAIFRVGPHRSRKWGIGTANRSLHCLFITLSRMSLAVRTVKMADSSCGRHRVFPPVVLGEAGLCDMKATLLTEAADLEITCGSKSLEPHLARHIVLPHTGTGQQHVITRVGACGMLRRWVSQLIP